MYASAVFAVLAGVAAAAPAVDKFDPVGSTTFELQNFNATTGYEGCAVLVTTGHGDGCQGVAVLSGGQKCSEITTDVKGPVCNGSVEVDFTKSPPFASYATWEYLAYCDIKDGGCVNKY